jgi:hypothetical protein
MIRKNGTIAFLLSGLCLLIIIAHVVLAGNGYEIPWWTIDGGSVSLTSSSSYAISGTIGQPDTGSMSNGSYDLAAGFWPYRGHYTVYVPVVLRSP